MSATTTVSTVYHPVAVTVVPTRRPGHYNTECDPAIVTITHANSVICYQIVSAPEGVQFWSLDITPEGQNQFSPPEIGAEGRMLTINDIDQEKVEETFHVHLKLIGPNGLHINHDPQIINRPG